MGITLHVEGISQSFVGKIASQQTSSSLACIFLRPEIITAKDQQQLAECTSGFSAVLNVQAELNGLPKRLSLAHSEACSRIQTDEVTLFVARNGAQARLRCPSFNSAAQIETLKTWLFGPALILSLARHSIYCLHASSIELEGRAYVLIGRSGAGKSTLARAANRPLTDDVSPIGRTELLPHFPQLKLNSGCYPNLAERYPLGGFIHVKRAEAGVESLSAIDAPALLRLLLSHTIATRLLHADELAPHLRWCAALSEQFCGRSAVLSPSNNPSAPAAAAQSAIARLSEFARMAA